MRYSMQELNMDETAEYCLSRMKLAGCTNDVFLPKAVSAIHTVANGFPRAINNIAVTSLIYSAERKMANVTEEAVYQANIETGI